MGQCANVSPFLHSLGQSITMYHQRVSCKYSRRVRLSASGSSRSPAESRLRRTNWSISTSRNSINKQRSPFRRRARCRSMRIAAEERGRSFASGFDCAIFLIVGHTRAMQSRSPLPRHRNYQGFIELWNCKASGVSTRSRLRLRPHKKQDRIVGPKGKSNHGASTVAAPTDVSTLPLFRRSTNPRAYGNSSWISWKVGFDQLWIKHLFNSARLSGDEFGARLISQSAPIAFCILE